MKFNLLLCALGSIVLTSPAMAYIDPGSGSAIMSAVVGFLVASAIAVKTYWYKIKSFFTPKSKKHTESGTK